MNLGKSTSVEQRKEMIMKYHLTRFAIISLKFNSEKEARELVLFNSGYNGVHVDTNSFRGVYDTTNKFARMMVAATRTCNEALAIDNEEAVIDDSLVETHHKAIEYYANLLSIQYRTGSTIVSPEIYAGIQPVDDEAKAHFAQAKRIKRNSLSLGNRMWPNDVKGCFNELIDRQDGVSLLAEALSHSHPTGRLHEYFRVIELAFTVSYRAACQHILLDYFKPTQYKIGRAELDSWIDARDKSTHADKNPFILLSETRKVIDRVELAAYDVLFNKAMWKDKGIDRCSIFAPVYYPLNNEDEVVIARGSAPRMDFQVFDGFHTYPLYLGKDLPVNLSAEWIVAH